MPTITYRRRSSVLRAALVATVLTAVTAVGHGTSRARADGGDTARAEAIGAALEATVGAGDLANETFSAPGEALVARDGQTVVEIPLDPADGVDVAAPNGVVVGIGLPGGEFADSAQVTSEGTVTYTDALPSASVAAQALADGGVRALVVIEGAGAPTEFRFPIEVPTRGRLELQPDGSVNVLSGDGMPAGHFRAPWATDATGREVPTSYRLERTVLVQTVAHSGNYPVVADPHYTWGWVTGTAYYDRAETKSLKTYSFALIVAGGLCAAFAWQTAGASCAISAALFSQWQYVASNAHGEGRCVKITIPTFWAYAYSGGHCR